MEKRRRFKQTTTLKDRLIAFTNEMRERALRLRPGPERDALLKKSRQAEVAIRLEDWVNSPGLQPPKGGSPETVRRDGHS